MKKSQWGFSIVELLISLALFAIIIPALTLGINTLTQINNRARDLTLISIIAENKIESLRSIGYNSIQVGTFDFSNELPDTIGSPKSATFTVTENSGIKVIDISVTFRDSGSNRTVSYKSAVGETGVAQ